VTFKSLRTILKLSWVGLKIDLARAAASQILQKNYLNLFYYLQEWRFGGKLEGFLGRVEVEFKAPNF
jgi:hypothetical protein